jgi:hypothetical protein
VVFVLEEAGGDAALKRIKTIVEELECGVEARKWPDQLMTGWSGLESRLAEKEAPW